MEQSAVRLLISVGMLAAIMVWELVAPSRARIWRRWQRWPSNLGLSVVGAMLQRLVLPLGVVSVATFAQNYRLGLLHYVALPQVFADLLTLVVFDLAIYWQHRVTHLVPWLWRLHLVHHADEDIDGTTALRFHPLEIILSMGLKSLLVLLMGPRPEAVLLFEILLNALAIFNHANAWLPDWLDRYLRLGIVTPDMHRVHHSIDEQEQGHNFGFNLTIWDRLFGSYQERSLGDPQSFPLGLRDWQKDQRTTTIRWLLLAPFMRRGRTL